MQACAYSRLRVVGARLRGHDAPEAILELFAAPGR
jgi:hypothetical protein